MTKETLADKMLYMDKEPTYLQVDDVKENVQNAQRRIKELPMEIMLGNEIKIEINKIFLEEFGKEIVK